MTGIKNRKISNDWIRAGLAVAMYLSCFMVALSIFQIPDEISETGSVPNRILLLLIAAAIVWFLVAYYSEEPAWRTTAKLAGYTVALSFVLLMIRGLGQVFDLGFSDPSSAEFLRSLSLAVLGAVGAVLVNKLINSKLLN